MPKNPTKPNQNLISQNIFIMKNPGMNKITKDTCLDFFN